MFWLLCLSIFLIPFSGAFNFVPNGNIWDTQYIAFLVLAYLFLSFNIGKFNKLLGFFSAYCMFSVIIIAQQHPRSLFCLNTLYFSILAIKYISTLDRKKINILLWALVGLVVAQGVLVCLQFMGWDPIFNKIGAPGSDDTVGLSGSHNQIGTFFAVTAPLVLVYCPYLIIFNIIGLFGATTTIAYFAFAVGALALVSRKYSALLVQAILVVGLIFFFRFESADLPSSIQERIELTKMTINQVETGNAVMSRDFEEGTQVINITSNKWVGFGLGNFIRISPHTQRWYTKPDAIGARALKQHRYSHAHNDFIEGYFELGRIGAFLIILLLIDFFFKFYRAKKTKLLMIAFAGVVAHLVCALGVFTIQTAVTGILLIIFLGIFYREIYYGKKRKIRWIARLAQRATEERSSWRFLVRRKGREIVYPGRKARRR